MDQREIVEAIATLREYGTETYLIEAKSAKGGFPKCYDTISSFSNKHGGTYPPIQKLTLMVKNRHYLWTIL